MNKRTRMILIVGAGALALYLLYRWYESNNSSSSAQAQQLAAEQAAQAADGSNGGAGGGYGDIASALGQEAQQEQSDVSGLASELANDEGLISTQGTDIGTLQNTVAAQALGEAKSASQLAGLEHKLGVTYGKVKPGKGFREKGVGGGWFQEVRIRPKPKPTARTTHQSRARNSGAVAASTHETKPRTTMQHSAKATESGSAKRTSARTRKPARKKVAVRR